jgi:hypothetical protein
MEVSSRTYLVHLKEKLKADLDQEDVLIVRRDIEAL